MKAPITQLIPTSADAGKVRDGLNMIIRFFTELNKTGGGIALESDLPESDTTIVAEGIVGTIEYPGLNMDEGSTIYIKTGVADNGENLHAEADVVSSKAASLTDSTYDVAFGLTATIIRTGSATALPSGKATWSLWGPSGAAATDQQVNGIILAVNCVKKIMVGTADDWRITRIRWRLRK